MGVEYSASAGYGIAGTTDNLPESFKKVEGHYNHDDGIQKIIDARGFDKIGYYHGGDFWGGPERWSILIKDTYTGAYGRHDSQQVITELDDKGINIAAYRQLDAIQWALGLGKYHVGWKLFFDVY